MTTPRRLLSIAVVASLALAACTAAATPAPTIGPSPTTAGATPTTDGTLPKPELDKITLSTPIGEPSQFGAVLADQLGIYQKYGIDVEIIKFNSGGDNVTALLSGTSDLGTSLDASFALSSQLTDTPAYAVAVYKNRVFDGLFCQPSIKTAADLKGKTIAVSSLGATAHASGLLALQGLKLTDKDVTFVPVGNNAARVAAMKAGSVGCAPVSMDQGQVMTDLGLNLLIDLSKDESLAYPGVGLGTRAEFHQKYPNTVLVMAAAIIEGQTILRTDLETAAREWATFAQVDIEKARTDVKAVQVQVSPSQNFKDEWFAFVQSVFAIVSPSIMIADPKKAGDHSVLQKLVDIGFYKKLGVDPNDI
jgi:ABC-type nitrate/sulfonate/bicarbonate transport system substrate-binding protein